MNTFRALVTIPITSFITIFTAKYKAIWTATWENQQSECAPSEDSDQPGHPPSLIRVFAVRMKKACVLSYLLSTQRRLWSDWVDTQADLRLRWAHSHFVGFVIFRLILSWIEDRSKQFDQDLVFHCPFTHMSHITRKRVFRDFWQVRFKPACSTTEAS